MVTIIALISCVVLLPLNYVLLKRYVTRDYKYWSQSDRIMCIMFTVYGPLSLLLVVILHIMELFRGTDDEASW